MNALKQIIAHLDALSLRERALVMLAAVGITIAAWDTLFLRPLSLERQRGAQEIETLRAEVGRLQSEAQATVQRGLADPDAGTRQELQSVKDRINTVNTEFGELTERLIPARRTASALESALKATHGLKLLGVKGIGRKPITRLNDDTLSDPAKTDALAEADAYFHGFQIEFEGTYFDTLAYMKTLEQLPWAFFWSSVKLETISYPQMRTVITVYTLSPDRSWIGV